MKTKNLTSVCWILGALFFGSLAISPAILADETAPARVIDKDASFRYEAQGNRDPFVPLVREGRLIAVTQSAAARELGNRPVLNGILWDSQGQSLALINEAEVRVGDVVDGYRIEAIEQDRVVLKDGDQTFALQIDFETPPEPDSEEGGDAP